MTCCTNRRATASSERHTWSEYPEPVEDAEQYSDRTKRDDRNDGDVGIADVGDGLSRIHDAFTSEGRYAGEKDTLRDEPVKDPGKYQQRYTVLVWQLQPVGRALRPCWTRNAQRFPTVCVFGPFIRKQHAGEDAVVRKIEKRE